MPGPVPPPGRERRESMSDLSPWQTEEYRDGQPSVPSPALGESSDGVESRDRTPRASGLSLAGPDLHQLRRVREPAPADRQGLSPPAHQREGATAHLPVGNLQPRLGHLLVAVRGCRIQGARPPPVESRWRPCWLDRLQGVEQSAQGQASLQGHDGVDVVGLIGRAHQAVRYTTTRRSAATGASLERAIAMRTWTAGSHRLLPSPYRR